MAKKYIKTTDPTKKKVKKTYPKSYTDKDKKFLKEQNEDIVRRSDFEEGSEQQKMFDRNQLKIKAKKKAKKYVKKKNPLHMNEYWYKIGNKKVTKAQYNAYENPVGDGPTKSTNDPDASGRKAEIAEARSKNKASKRPTALTEAQTKLKDQGTKLPKKKPPFKADGKFKEWANKEIKSGKYAKEKARNKTGYTWKTSDGTNRSLRQVYDGVTRKQGKHNSSSVASPLDFSWKGALDKAQLGLTGLGMVPGLGNIADGVNTAVSAGRAGYAKYKGDEAGYKTHRNNAAINAAAMVPGAGLAVGASKLAKAGAGAVKGAKVAKAAKAAKTATQVAKAGTKTTAKGIAKKGVKKAVVLGAKKGQAHAVNKNVANKKMKRTIDNTANIGKKSGGKKVATPSVSKNVA